MCEPWAFGSFSSSLTLDQFRLDLPLQQFLSQVGELRRRFPCHSSFVLCHHDLAGRAEREAVLRQVSSSATLVFYPVGLAQGRVALQEVPLEVDRVSREMVAMMLVMASVGSGAAQAKRDDMPLVHVSKDRKGFVLEPSGSPFVPWGLNYDHDSEGRLIEDYWEAEWPTVETHFDQMKKMGANVVRVHLQLGKFMDGPEKPNARGRIRLGKLLELAKRLRLYLDLTGLGCYHKKDVPAWYDKLSEKDRWGVQARFWQAVAGRARRQPRRILLRPDERAGGAGRPPPRRRLARAYALKVAQISSRLLGWARPCFSANLVDVPERPRTRALIAEANTGLS